MVESGATTKTTIRPNLLQEALTVGDVEEIDTLAPPRQDWLEGTDDSLRKG